MERDPERDIGAWVFRDARIPAAALAPNVEDGGSVADVVAWFTAAPRQQVPAVLGHGSRSTQAWA